MASNVTSVMRATVGRESYGGVPVTAAHCPDTVVFLLDLSGSMQGKQEISVSRRVTGAAQRAGAGVSPQVGRIASNAARRTFGLSVNRLTAAQFALNSTLNALYVPRRPEIPRRRNDPRSPSPPVADGGAPAYFALFGFNNGVQAWKTGVHPATEAAAALPWIGMQSASGGTSIRAALQAAFAVRGVDAIYLLSDGEPTDADPNTILAEVAQWNRTRRVRVHTIGVGDDRGEPFLCALAEQNNGLYTYDGELRCGRRPLVAFVGGKDDEWHRNMARTFCSFNWNGFDKAFFQHNQDAALVKTIRDRRQAFPGVPVAIAGHSWGGDTGYKGAGELARHGVAVDLLVTLDAVSRASHVQSQFPRPGNVRRWVNVYIPGVAGLSDVVASVGGWWGRQDGAGADNVAAPRNQASSHADAAGMLFRVPRATQALQALGGTARR
ncbi:MAG TPA: hypothetical protein VFS20_29450 [Longimicrobium sp.]|nr:hypothetical protein [Longimicrobium sp.]